MHQYLCGLIAAHNSWVEDPASGVPMNCASDRETINSYSHGEWWSKALKRIMMCTTDDGKMHLFEQDALNRPEQ
jgi:hypothetical protein